MMHEHILQSTEATLDYGRALAGAVRQGDIIALSGNLAAGKTTLTRGLLHGLGLPEGCDVPSPSYTLMQYYEAPPLRLAVWHIDLYRLSNEADILGLGLDDIYDESVSVIEWPERMGFLLPKGAFEFSLDIISDDRRLLRYPDAFHALITDKVAR